ncbi:MAG: APC family permease [Lentihominibacter sp.]|jgi:amino acid transporter
MSKNTIEALGYKQELKRALTVPDLVCYGLIFMVPIAPFGIYGTVMSISEGMVALAYSIGLVGMIFTAFSYWRMAEEFPIAGSVYGYASKAIGKPVGFMSGWVILLDYLLVPTLLYIVAGTALSAIPGFDVVPMWAWMLFFIAINTVINIIGIEWTNRFNWIMLVLEIIVFLIFCIAAIHYIVTTPDVSFTFDPIYNENFSMEIVMAAVSVCVLSFLGFDGISTLAEETKGGADSIGKGSVFAILIVGAFFITQTYLAACVLPWNGEGTFADVESAFYEVANLAGGAKVMVICAVATGFSWGIADCMVAQAAISRIIFSMARDRMLPKVLAKVSPRFQTPYVATAFIAVFSLFLTIGSIYLLPSAINAIAVVINFGGLSAFIILNFTVIYYFWFKKKTGKVWKHLILPGIGFLIIAYIWTSLSWYALTLGIIWLCIGVVFYIVNVKVLHKDVDLKLE